jgi:hypothetical protein
LTNLPYTTLSLALILQFLLLGAPLSAQTTTSVIAGRVFDSTGAVMADVTVQVIGPVLHQTTVSDANGYYQAVRLTPDTYIVRASRSGFRTLEYPDVAVRVNQVLSLDLRMEPAVREEVITVRPEISWIDSSASALSQIVDPWALETLPLNGRNYLDLLRVTPGVVVNENAVSQLSGRDSRGSILGERAGNTAFLIDGLNNNDDYRGGPLQAFSPDAVGEFEIISAGYKAEFGRGSGGIVNVITKSGTNEFTGSGYTFLRNDALDSSNVSGEEAPELERHHYGFTAGGPLQLDQSWYFGSVESISETREALFAPDIPDALRSDENFSVKPATDEHRLFGKYTQRLGEQHDVRLTGSWTRLEDRHALPSPTSLPSAGDDSRRQSVSAEASHTLVLSPRLSLESAIGLRDQRFDGNPDQRGERSFSVGFIDTGGSFQFGPPLAGVQTLDQRYYSAREVVSFFAGREHTFKAGLEYTRTIIDGANDPGLLNVIVTTRAGFEMFGRESFQIPQGVGFLTDADRFSRLRNHGASLFAQDDWRPRDDITFNAGLRYDYDSRFGDTNNLAPRLGVVWTAGDSTIVRGSWGLFYDRYRLGVAQAIPEFGGFNGLTVAELDYPRLAADALPVAPGSLGALGLALGDPWVVHTWFGIPRSAVVTEANIQSLTGLTPAGFLSSLHELLDATGVSVLPLDFSPFTGFLRQDLGASFQDRIQAARPFHTPFNVTATLGVERLIRPGLSVDATYVHRSIRNILGVRVTNLARVSREVGGPLTTDGGPLLRTYGSWFDGTYRAFILGVNKRFDGRYQLQGNYTYARATDNLLNSNFAVGLATQGGGAVPTDNLDLEFDRGHSDLSVPHTFVVSGTAELPLDILISGVIRASSGMHFSASGAPTDYDGDGIVSNRPPETTRNEFSGPASFNMDARVEKRFRLGGPYTLSVLLETFNLTNARNPRLINDAFVDGSPGPGFGGTLVPQPGREAQVGLRLRF